MDRMDKAKKIKTTATILAFVLGIFGVHKFYLKKPAWGLFFLILFFIFGIKAIVVAIIDGILILVQSKEVFAQAYVTNDGNIEKTDKNQWLYFATTGGVICVLSFLFLNYDIEFVRELLTPDDYHRNTFGSRKIKMQELITTLRTISASFGLIVCVIGIIFYANKKTN